MLVSPTTSILSEDRCEKYVMSLGELPSLLDGLLLLCLDASIEILH